MTLVATRVRELVVTIDVTQLTRSRNMSPRQRELRRTVIERRRFPNIRRMTCLACVTESCRNVIWIRRRGKIC